MWFFWNWCAKVRNKCAIKIQARASWLPSMSRIYPASSLYLILTLLPVVVFMAEADAKTNDANRTRAARETTKNWRRGEKLKNVCAQHISSSVLLFVFSSTSLLLLLLLLLPLLLATADDDYRNSLQQPQPVNTLTSDPFSQALHQDAHSSY